MPRPPDLETMVSRLAWRLAAGEPSDDDRKHAAQLLAELGVPDLLATLSLVEGILRFGEGFHPIARFFIDGSPEQAYLVDLARRWW